jgi:uncharacterized protein with HEPN domain
MSHDPEKFLSDMLSSCEFLLEFTAGKSVSDYMNDRGFRSAVERELQIIGEALMQLDRIAPEKTIQVSDHRRIIALATFLFTATIASIHELYGMLSIPNSTPF